MGRSWDYYNEIAHLYDSQYEEPYWKLYHTITERLIERLIKQHNIPSPLNVLDLGSGTGFLMEYFVEMGKSEHLHFSARKPFYKQLTHRKAFFN